MTRVHKIHVGDIGTKFLITLEDDGEILDISAAITKNIFFAKPSGNVLTKTATFETDGTDGKLYWTTIENDLDEDGLWSIQAYVELALGEWKTNVLTFVVHANLA